MPDRPATPADQQSGGAFPRAQGLYNPKFEHDACGIGLIADIKGRQSHEIIQNGLKILVNLTHRGAVGADPLAGDGAGALLQIPHEFFSAEAERLGFSLPEPGQYGVGQFFLSQDAEKRARCEEIIAEIIKAEGQTVLGWRDVPVDNSGLPKIVLDAEPCHRQVFIGRNPDIATDDDFERRLYITRKSMSDRMNRDSMLRSEDYYFVSMSCRTIVYKGMFLAFQLGEYFKDLHDPRFKSALALVHQRFSTNTFPSWRLAHPFRMIAHNGEINTLRGNVNWMAARQASVSSPLFGDEITKLWPISYEGQSDTACFDNALEFLVQGGHSLTHAMMMMIPEAWDNNPLMDPKRRAFYEYHAALMEPWDGPAAVAFTDGRQIGATLDRNGLRPARYFVTDDDKVILASEMGVLPYPEEKIIEKWRLQPGKMLLIDLEKGRIVSDEEIKSELAESHPFQDWLDAGQVRVSELEPTEHIPPHSNDDLLDLQQAFGYTQESWKFVMQPMVEGGQEAIGSMGTDTPVSALSNKPKLLHTYFKQNFAQVTNPPIDPIREELVMSLVSMIGPRPNLLGHHAGTHYRLEVNQPILTNADLEKIRSISTLVGEAFRTCTLDATWPAAEGADGMARA
ncbi:MAG TPA: glutamate synthase central domain-containing protein, partial [Hyphomicrobiales bacterium]|nr:glutamate synthase central domain-containing protein [Hyphomicrobiales bacterium]